MQLVTCMSVWVCAFGSGDIADDGQQQSGRGRGPAGGQCSGQHGVRVFASQSRNIWRFRQSPDEHL